MSLARSRCSNDDALQRGHHRDRSGKSVEWVTVGDSAHTIFASDGSWESELVMERGTRYTRTFDETGVYPYFCTFHGNAEGGGMAGYVVVGDVDEYETLAVDDEPSVPDWSGATINVPGDQPTIQEAVDAAHAGDMVFIESGVYNESVTVDVPSLIVRGADRSSTVLDGASS